MERTPVFSGRSAEAEEEESEQEWRRFRWANVAGQGTEQDRTIIKSVPIKVSPLDVATWLLGDSKIERFNNKFCFIH